MLARQAFRAAAPIRTQARGYASQGSSGGGGLLGYAAVGAGLGLGGYYYYANVLNKAPAVPSASELAAKAKGGSFENAFKGGEQGFLSLKLEDVEKINHNTSRFRFALEDNQVSGLPVASAVITKFQGANDEKPTIRPYTPTSPTDAVGYMDFVIKKYPNGPMSEYIHNMEPGQRLDVKGPIPKVPITTNKYNHIALIAGGTGITPMWQIAQAIFKNSEDKTKVTLVYGNISEEDILLRKELQQLENTYPQRFRVFYTLDKPPKEWSQGKGFISQELLKTVLPEPKTENLLIGVCGPPGLMKAISGAKKSPKDQGDLEGSLKALGYSKEQVFKF